ncbi:MAG TPA: hypothetical protein PKG48_10250 [Bacteroidales bacterium]|nr:hypothetical protein [Bacteroidales bacterium]HPS63347.1 hypothetical protein [Bacteroidales bacterium]
MNFFRRKKILSNANFLDLRPVKLLDHRDRDDGCVDLLMPRFRKRWQAKMLQPAGKERFISIKLDRFGSRVWLLIDGVISTGSIAEKLNSAFPEELLPPDETPVRVTKFLSLLYQQRYITFREITDEENIRGTQ